jgi:two-component system sensor histidine kinase YesM
VTTEHSKPERGWSLNVLMIIAVLSILLPFCAYLLYNNFYTINLVRQQVAESNYKTVTLHIREIEKNLRSVHNYLLTLTNEYSLHDFAYSPDNNKHLQAKTLLYNKIRFDIASLDDTDALFIYNPSKAEFITAYSDNHLSLDVKKKVENRISTRVESLSFREELEARGFFLEEIDGAYYLFRMFWFDGLYLGACGAIVYYAEPLELLDLGGGVMLFTDSEGVVLNHLDFISAHGIELTLNESGYTILEADESYLAISVASTLAPLRLAALIPNREILKNMVYLTSISTLVLIFSVVIAPLAIILLLRLNVMKPLKRVSASMNEIRTGRMESRIDVSGMPSEIYDMAENFNSMVEQVKTLKINVYEEQLSKHREELDKLRLQINPHFFMNTLNIIYSLAQIRDYALIKEISHCLARYYQYISRKNWDLVELNEEIEHVQYYVKIQGMRYPDCFSFQLEVADDTLEIHVPPLIIQTFIENAIKYAVNPDEFIHIIVNSYIDEAGFMKLIISNSGKCFAHDVLKDLNSGKRIIDGRGEQHIGIWNLRRRLELLYGGKARLVFRNEEPQGVAADISIPL